MSGETPRGSGATGSDRAGETAAGGDAYTRPTFSLKNRALRLLWGAVWLLLYRPSPRPFHAWRALLLRLFGARLGPKCHFYPASRVWAPWNLVCEDHVCAGQGAEIYNPAEMYFESHAILSQDCLMCGATHQYNDVDFPLMAYPTRVGRYAWICARASVGPGVQVGEGAVLGLQAVATRDLLPWTVYGGNPAVPLKARDRSIAPAAEEGA
jgi:putative colanic acid biosynthesis acetyltransferase WcaF